MAIDLTKPLDDTVISAPEKSFMKNLQANILKGHGREHVALLFLAVTDVGKAPARGTPRPFLTGCCFWQ